VLDFEGTTTEKVAGVEVRMNDKRDVWPYKKRQDTK